MDYEDSNAWAIATIVKMVMYPQFKLKRDEAHRVAQHLSVLTGKPWRVVSRLGVAQREFRVRPGEAVTRKSILDSNPHAGGTI